MERVGSDGVITIEESVMSDTTLELLEGTQLQAGYLSPYFVTDTRRAQTSYEDAYVLVSERKLSTTWELVPLLEQLAKAPKPLLIVADDVVGDALSTLVVNKLRGSLDCVAVKAPSFGNHRKEALRDVAALTGAQTISEEHGLRVENVTLAALGRARRVTVDKDTTTIVGGDGSKERIAERVSALRSELARAREPREDERLRGRLAKLAGGVAVLRVGGQTESAMKHSKAQAENALRAMRGAAREGIVPGGGVALIRAQQSLDTLDLVFEERAGVDIIRRALERPLWQIAENSGRDGNLVVQRVRATKGDFGYDATRDELAALTGRGIADPLCVVRSALQKAASVAALMLTSECLIAGLAPAR
jgi:chaperonin GroEL